jgi:predicted GNAT family acetyltransferase
MFHSWKVGKRMLIKEYDEEGLFLKDYEYHIRRKEAVGQLLLYPAYNSLSPMDEGREIYGAVLQEQEPILLFCNKIGHNLILLSLQQENSVDAAVALADYFGSRNIAITGITGQGELCQSFIDQYKMLVPCNFIQNQETEIMEVRQVNEQKTISGQQRLADPSEAKLVADWMLRFWMEARMSELDYEAALVKATWLIEEKKLYLYENEEGEAVSMAAICKTVLSGIMITYIYTPEEYRGMGYTASNIYYLSKFLLTQGYDFCTLLSDKKNLLLKRAYEKVGYRTLEDVCRYMLLQP